MNEPAPEREPRRTEPWPLLVVGAVLVVLAALAIADRNSMHRAPDGSRQASVDTSGRVVTYLVTGPQRAHSISYNVGGHVNLTWKIMQDERLPWQRTTTFPRRGTAGPRAIAQLAATAPADQDRKIRIQVTYRGRPVALDSARPGHTARTSVDLAEVHR